MNSGAYRVFISIKKKISLSAGSLGVIELTKGRYCYTGSAMKNLNQRVARHLRKDKKLYWHIDYLLNDKNVEIEKIDKFESESRIECELNKELLKSGASVPIPGFGSSDCRICPSHLLKL